MGEIAESGAPVSGPATGEGRRGGKIVPLEGLRGVAALSVLAYHANQLSDVRLPGWLDAVVDRGWTGVPVFFVLSGFLLFRPFAAAIVSGAPWPSVRRYARARALRIFPAYLVVLSITALSLWGATLGTFGLLTLAAGALIAWRGPWRLLAGVVLAVAVAGIAVQDDPGPNLWDWVTNATLTHMTLGRGWTLIGPAWSLCVEAAFYVVLPLLALGLAAASRRAPARATLLVSGVLVGVAVTGLVCRSLVDELARPQLPMYLDWFAVGMLVAVALERRSLGRRGADVLGVAALVLAVCAPALDGLGPAATMGNHTGSVYGLLVAVAAAAAVAAVAGDPGCRLGRILSVRPASAAGVISYGIFLWNMPLVQVLERFHVWPEHAWASVPLLLAVTVPVAMASWRYVERPALARARPRREALAPVRPPASDVTRAAGGVVVHEST